MGEGLCTCGEGVQKTDVKGYSPSPVLGWKLKSAGHTNCTMAELLSWKLPLSTPARTLCYREQLNAIGRGWNFKELLRNKLRLT
jgi:hypothetical protein